MRRWRLAIARSCFGCGNSSSSSGISTKQRSSSSGNISGSSNNNTSSNSCLKTRFNIPATYNVLGCRPADEVQAELGCALHRQLQES